jgi:cellulose synthase operon protein C
MGLTVALVATIALAASPEAPRDAAGWRARSDASYTQGDFRAALEAAEKARLLDPADPWARYAWAKALAAVDPDAARRALPGLQNPETMEALTAEDLARLETALGYLCLDLGMEQLAAMHFDRVAATTASFPKAQAGLAILAVRRGNSRQAIQYFVAARVIVRADPSLAELERDARYDVVLRDFTTARDLRDANAAGRAYAVLDELRPNHPATLQARADLANLRGDQPARERALRDLLAVDAKAPGAAGQLVDTLLALNRPYEAYAVARDMAPERLAGDAGLQAIQREWVSHLEAALDSRWRNGQTDHDRLELQRVMLTWSASHPRWGRVRVLGDIGHPDSDRVPAGEPFGSSVGLSAPSQAQTDKGFGGLIQWSPRSGTVVELGTTPTSYHVSNLVGAVRFRIDSQNGPWLFGFDRSAVQDSLLSYAGTVDPVTGQAWGGVVRNRAYFGGHFASGDLEAFGQIAGALLDGKNVDENAEWRANAGFLRRAASGEHWVARLGGSVEAMAFEANRSHFTLGHGGYFSPDKFLSIGPVFELVGRRDDRSFRLEGGIAWQEVRESSSRYFPTDAALQAASGDPRYPGDSRDGVGLRLSASLEWRVTENAVAGVRLEGVRGEDADEVRLQIYARRWSRAIADPVQEPPVPLSTSAAFPVLN